MPIFSFYLDHWKYILWKRGRKHKVARNCTYILYDSRWLTCVGMHVQLLKVYYHIKIYTHFLHVNKAGHFKSGNDRTVKYILKVRSCKATTALMLSLWPDDYSTSVTNIVKTIHQFAGLIVRENQFLKWEWSDKLLRNLLTGMVLVG